MGSCATLMAPCIFLTEFTRVTEALTVETAKGVGDENIDLVADVTSEESFRQSRCFKCENEEAGVLPLTVDKLGETADMRHSFDPQTFQDLFWRHESHFGREDGAFGAVSRGMERDSHRLLTEAGTFQQCLCL